MYRSGTTRREMLTLLTTGTALAMAGHFPAHAQNAPSNPRTRLVILGSAAGRASYRGAMHGGFSAAVQVDRDVYLVDFGAGWLDAYLQAGLGPSGRPHTNGGLETLRAGFITHMHADHTADYGRLIQFGTADGLQRRREPVTIMGPGRVADARAMYKSLLDPAKLVRPEMPAPGVSDMTKSLIEAFATDVNDNMADGGKPHHSAYLNVKDIELPASVKASAANVAPRMSPFEIYRDDKVCVLATLVDHAPIYPCYAFRFETPGGAIVFSGDTNRSENLIEMSKDADVLVHEAISAQWVEGLFAKPLSREDAAKARHLIEAHTEISEIGPLAQQAGVKTLVLSHLAPPTYEDAYWLSNLKGFSGKAMVGRRKFELVLPNK